MTVKGMTCASCVASVEAQVRAIPGVADITASCVTDSARVTFDAEIVSVQEILDAIEDAGFGTELQEAADPGTVTLKVNKLFIFINFGGEDGYGRHLGTHALRLRCLAHRL